MSIVSCDKCGKFVDLDYSSDDMIGETCISCVEDMSLEELLAFGKGLSSQDQDYVNEVIADLREEEERKGK